jgi:hypothetical protein
MARKTAIDTMNLETGDKVVITGAGVAGRSGGANLIKVETI